MFRNQSLLVATLATTGLMFACTSANAASLLHNWTFDTNTNDSAGSVNGTAEGDAAIVAGKIGNAISLDGDGDYVSFAAGTVTPVTDYTVTAWVFWENDGPTADRARIVGGQQSGDFGEVFDLRATGSGTQLFLNALENGGQGDSITESTGGDLGEDVWVHVAYSISSTGGTTLYVNGAVVANTATRTTHDPAATFAIGTRSDLPATETFGGLIDDVAIFDGVLTTSELATVRDSGAAAVPEPTSLALLGLGGLCVLRRRRSI